VLKILWFTNLPMPAVAHVAGVRGDIYGGWLQELLRELAADSERSMTVACFAAVNDVYDSRSDNVRYLVFPISWKRRDGAGGARYAKWVNDEIGPDIVHIHGTEFGNGLELLDCPRKFKALVSIQGLISECAKALFKGLGFVQIISNITIRDILRFDALYAMRRDYYRRGLAERLVLSRVDGVIGRTLWDRAHVRRISPFVEYFHCNETLRRPFYTAVPWQIGFARPKRIFVSQLSYPLKGAHQLLKALSIVKKRHDDFELHVAGTDVIRLNEGRWSLRRSGYGSILYQQIIEFGLSCNVKFLGELAEQDMITEYQAARIVVVPSALENSSNSLGEAQLLGVPCVAAAVGGMCSMGVHSGALRIYPFDDIELLAEEICGLFESDDACLALSRSARLVATGRHDIKSCVNAIVEIYRAVSR
jgi:L-malate glycosyltransferase